MEQHSRRSRHGRIGALSTMICFLLPAAAFSQTYLPGPASTVGDIQSETVNTVPGPTVSDHVGIGETVNCWIDPSTWKDTDLMLQGESYVPVPDTMGTITWSVSGAGSVYPTTGDSTTLTAYLADADGTITVQAAIPDSGTEGIDPVLMRALAFAMKVPNGINATYNSDKAIGTPGPPNNQIGAETIFDVQILPNTVNFNAVNFREDIPANPWTWNDGTKDNFGPQIVAFNVANKGGTPNWTTDDCTIALRPVARLAGKNQTVTWKIPDEYQDMAGKWQVFLAGETHANAFDGTKLTCTITDNVTNAASGTAQGPWQ